jgi:hypothetical protein
MFSIMNYVTSVFPQLAAQRVMGDPWVIAYGTQAFGVVGVLTLASVPLVGYLYRS